MTAFLALIRKDRTSDYGVDFPDFPGCVTAGRTLEEARELASEALAFHVKGMLEDGLPIPSPSPLDRVNTDGAVVLTVELPELRTVRVNLTIPSTDLAIIDSYLRGRRGVSRSGLMVSGALKLIDRDRSLIAKGNEAVEQSQGVLRDTYRIGRDHPPAVVRPGSIKVRSSRLAAKKPGSSSTSPGVRRSPSTSPRVRK
jgi:predicted RNase H-like HicB family nuclease